MVESPGTTRAIGFTAGWLLLPACLSASPGLTVAELRCEYLADPVGIDTTDPRLSWEVLSGERGQVQTVYQILVASSEEKLRRDEGDLWDTGRVESDRTAHVIYAGKQLTSRRRCHWKVRAWDRDGAVSEWSPPARWEMGYLSPVDWKGKWIGRTAETSYSPAPHFRREFTVAGKVSRATLIVAGLGYHEVSLNGEKVGDHHLDPGYTRYDKRVLYVTHDVTGQVREGKNAVGVILGTGWYNVHALAVWNFDKAPWRAAPKLLMDLWIDYQDGRSEVIATDESWKAATGPITFDSIYGGESYDARLERPGWNLPGYDDTGWQPALLVEAPKGRLVAQQMPPIRVSRTLTPTRITEPKPGVFVYDIGQNCSGFAQLFVSGPAGTTVTLKYAERLRPDGTVDASNIAMHMVKTDPPQRFQTDTYTLKGQGQEVWESRFVYHGFQYVEVTGAPGKRTLDNLCVKVCHSAISQRGRFECSNPLLNRIWQNTLWSYLSNLQGIPTDCPHREKNGWTGDAHLAAEQGLYNFDPAAVYTKWVNDLDDEQRKADEGKRHKGELPGIVPTSGWGYDWGNGPAWDSALLLVPWYLYEYCGDTRILTSHYDAFRLYVDYLTRRAQGGIVSIGLGDWCPHKTETPVEVTSTGYYYRDALIAARVAGLIGKAEDAVRYAQLAASIRKAFLEKFVDAKTGNVSNGSQTALGCALYQGLVERDVAAATLKRLVEAVEKTGGYLDFGILGSKYVLNALTAGGRSDVAYRVASQKGNPSWGHWLEQGATTLWESWGGVDSRNHIMFGDVSAWFYKALAGINGDPEAPGFKRIVIRPQPVGDLTWVRAEYHSIRGMISSGWRKEAGTFRLDVVIPANATATVHLPAGAGDRIEEGGKPIAEASCVKLLRREGDRVVLETGSGSYGFLVSRP